MKKIINISKSVILFLIAVCLIGCSQAVFSTCDYQGDPYVPVVKKCETFTCVNEVDSTQQAELKKQGKRMLQIYLIRHAKPNIKRKMFYSAEEARQEIIDYNSVPIIPFDKDLVQVNLGDEHIIYCSNLPRSQETALHIFGDRFQVVSDSIFREYEIRVVNANSIVKLPLWLWQFFNRGSWLLGYNHRGIESRKEAGERTKQAAENLIKVAELEETAILVAHGLLNAGIENELERQGWKLIQKKGQTNLGATILFKIIDLE